MADDVYMINGVVVVDDGVDDTYMIDGVVVTSEAAAAPADIVGSVFRSPVIRSA